MSILAIDFIAILIEHNRNLAKTTMEKPVQETHADVVT
jgi:hypothetical protein